jgi:phosphate transport system permease protein
MIPDFATTQSIGVRSTMTQTQKSSGASKNLTLIAVLTIILILGVIIFNIIFGGIRSISWTFLSSPPEHGMTEGGIFPAIFGTVALVILMVIFGVPIGVMTAVYLQEYTRPDSIITRVIRIAINNWPVCHRLCLVCLAWDFS